MNQHEIVDKDIYVLFSDGVSDNIYHDQEIRTCITSYLDEFGILQSLSSVADCIAIHSYFKGKDPNHDGPFAKGAREAYRQWTTGGKHDDITVTVAQLFKDQDGVARRADVDPHKKESVYLYKGAVGKQLWRYQ